MSSGDGASQSSSKKSKKPQYSRFTQQELPACKPILTPAWVIATFISIGFVFVPIGLVALSASQRVVEIVDRYDDLCIPSSKTDESDSNLERAAFVQSDKTNKTCIRTLTVPKKMQSPVFIYYELENFYQNHRRRVRKDRQASIRWWENKTMGQALYGGHSAGGAELVYFLVLLIKKDSAVTGGTLSHRILVFLQRRSVLQ
nr:ALA-interacting subunit 3-like [Ipomoea batatas]